MRQREVNEALDNIVGAEYSGVHKDHYRSLSQHIHPNREAIDLGTWNSEGKEAVGRKSIIGGYINKDLFPLQFSGLLVLGSTATMLLGIVGLHEATGTWKQECDKLQEDVYAIADKCRSSYSSLAKRGT